MKNILFFFILLFYNYGFFSQEKIIDVTDGGFHIKIYTSIIKETTTSGKIKERNYYYASFNDEKMFYIGKEFPYDNFRGIGNLYNDDYKHDKYNNTTYTDKNPENSFWYDFIYPITEVESTTRYDVVNSYDGHFTFGLIQGAEHDKIPFIDSEGKRKTYAGDLIRLFRNFMIQNKDIAASYFPDLFLKDSILYQRTKTEEINLEVEDKDKKVKFIYYLNENLKEIDDKELINAAKLIHISRNVPAFNKLQVETAILHFKLKLWALSTFFYKLHGVVDFITLFILDIYHQGRAMFETLTKILNEYDIYEYTNLYKSALIPIILCHTSGKLYQPERLSRLWRIVLKFLDQNTFGQYFYDKEKRDFYPSQK